MSVILIKVFYLFIFLNFYKSEDMIDLSEPEFKCAGMLILHMNTPNEGRMLFVTGADFRRLS